MTAVQRCLKDARDAVADGRAESVEIKLAEWLARSEGRELDLRKEVAELRERLAPCPGFNERLGLDEYGLPL